MSGGWEFSDNTARIRPLILLCAVLGVITLSIYWPAGDHEFIDYDDNIYVYDNLHVAEGLSGSNIIWAFTSVEAANWHPITWLSHMTDSQLYGMDPRGHHLTSVLIHTFSGMLLLLLLFRLTGSLWQSSFVAAMFALHPLHVESVAWVSERKDVLSAFFFFLTLLFHASYVKKRKPALYLLTLLSFILGLMSKPMLVTLPLVMLMMDFWPLNRDFIKERNTGLPLIDRLSPLFALLKEKIPFFAFSLLSAAVTIYAQNKGEAIKSLEMIPLGFRIENAVTAYIQYLVKTLLPRDLAVFYPLSFSLPLWQVICSSLILLFVSAITVWRARRYPCLAVGWFWYLVTLVPVIGLVQVGVQSMADRYTYIPLAGFFIMVAWGVPALAKNMRYRRSILAALACAVIAASAAVTRQQLGYWQDSLSLFRHALQVTTDNSVMHNSIACSLEKKGDLDAAIMEYREALVISPHLPESHNNMGRALELKGDLDAAVGEYREALLISPDLPETHNNLGRALAKKGDLDAAVGEYREALARNPGFASAHSNLGHALEVKGDLDEAIREYQLALAINPRDFISRNNLGVDFWKKGDLDGAIREYRQTLAINPNYLEAHYNLGLALDGKGDLEGAIREYRQTLAINPNLTMARDRLNSDLDRLARLGKAPE